MTDGSMTDEPVRAWQRGREAALSDVAADANPYDLGSELAADWADGWHEGTKLGNLLVDGEQAWAAWRASPGEGEAGHDRAP